VLFAAVVARALFDWSADPDLWGHLHFGLLTLGGDFPRVDSSSFTASGLRVVNHEWLAEAVMAGFYSGLGPTGVGVFKVLAGGAIVFLLWNILSAVPLVTRAVVMSVLLTVLTPGLAMRPQLFTYLFILWLARRLSRAAKVRAVEMFVLFAVWANLHAGWLFGLGMVGAYAVCRPGPERIVAVAAAAAGTLINPYGWHLWSYLVEELSNPISREVLAEWVPFQGEMREAPFFLLFLLIGVGIVIERRRVPEFQVIVYLASAVLGFLSVRHTPILALANSPLIATLVVGAMERMKVVLSGASKGILGAAFVAAAALLVLKTPPGVSLKLGEDSYPLGALQWLKQSGFCRRLWVPLHWGGISLFHLAPETKVSIDGRWATLYPRETMQQNLDFELTGEGGKWKTLLSKHSADCALVELSNIAWGEMNSDPEWGFAIRERSGGLLLKRSDIEKLPLPKRASSSGFDPFAR